MLMFFIGATATLQPSSMPLPRSPPAAAAQAAKSTMKALRTSSPPVRLQIQIHGESVEEEDPLPVLSLCAELVEVLGDSQFANMHFFFDDAHAARAWQQLAPAAAACTRSSVLCEATGEPAQRLQDDALLVLVAPCNRRREVAGQPGLELSGAAGRAEREAAKAAKLESVQRLVCGAQQVPIVLVNPDLEALLVTQRIGKATPPPMFMSDFEHAFFLAEADAVRGHVSAVRRLWGRAWEVYRVTAEKAAAAAAADPAAAAGNSGSSSSRRAGRRAGGGVAGATTALERTTLSEWTEYKPRSADTLAAYARRRRGDGNPRPAVPGRTSAAAWEAEDGWR